MKKIASIVLAVMMVFSMFTFMSFAADKVSLTMRADSTTAKVGDVVTVTVGVPKDSNLGGITIDLMYDSSVLKVVVPDGYDAKEGTGYPTKNVFPLEIVNLSYRENAIRYMGTSMSGAINEAADLLSFQFEVIKAGEATLTLTASDCFDANDGEVAVSGASIKVVAADKPVDPPKDPVEPENPDECKHEKYSTQVTKPTCTEPGKKVTKCSVCGEGDVVVEEIPATGHKAGGWKVVKEATTTSTGKAEKRCQNLACGEVLETRVLPKLPSDELTKPAIPNTDAIA